MADMAEVGQPFSRVELQQAFRNRGMPLEALRYDVTPTGLHYLLTHFDIPELDESQHQLRVGGHVTQPLELSVADLRSMPARTIPVTLECAGNGRALMEPRAMTQPWLLEAVGTAEWTGTPLSGVLDTAGIEPGTVELVFTGADHGVQGEVEQDYMRALPIAEARRPEVLLAYEMNGRPLEPQHGYPLRLLVPGWYGMTSVKWLTRIDAVTEPFTGYQQAVAYRFQHRDNDPGEPVDRMRVRALMVPPGVPDFPDRNRLLDAGPVTLRGRAWCGTAPIERVDVGIDGEWEPAVLGPAQGAWAWRPWSYEWNATVGVHELACRATDSDAQTQPIEVAWNSQGMANNLIQTVTVTVR